MKSNKTELIYMDNAATTRVTAPVLEAMLPWLCEQYGNPSAIHRAGQEARGAIETARRKVAEVLNAEPSEIYFTSGGTESDNCVINGIAEIYSYGEIITTTIEHPAVMRPCEELENLSTWDWLITKLPVDEYGRVSAEQIESAICNDDTRLVSVMAVNNEIGTVEPIWEIEEICRKYGVLFHTDAVQAVGTIDLDVKAMKVDFLSLSGHKFHAPKGVGVLYVRKGVKLPPMICGGGQERGMRSGTENVAGIVGLGEAISRYAGKSDTRDVRDHMIRRILNEIPDVKLNGHPTDRAVGNVNVSFRGVDGEALLQLLDAKGICCSAGSACASHSMEPSHVLNAIGLSDEEARGTLRFSLCEENTTEQADYVVDLLKEAVGRLRLIAPR